MPNVETKTLNWTELNDLLRTVSEEAAKHLMTQEVKTTNRPTFKMRIYSKYSLLRKKRELKELLRS